MRKAFFSCKAWGLYHKNGLRLEPTGLVPQLRLAPAATGIQPCMARPSYSPLQERPPLSGHSRNRRVPFQGLHIDFNPSSRARRTPSCLVFCHYLVNTRRGQSIRSTSTVPCHDRRMPSLGRFSRRPFQPRRHAIPIQGWRAYTDERRGSKGFGSWELGTDLGHARMSMYLVPGCSCGLEIGATETIFVSPLLYPS